MAKILTFRYDCGYEVSVPVQPGMSKTSLAAWASPMVSRRHKKECVPCQRRRHMTAMRRWHGDDVEALTTTETERVYDPNQLPATEGIVFTTKATRDTES